MSAAKAICDHVHDWWHGTKDVREENRVFVCIWIGILE
jgi:hypothetical protein